MKLPALFVDAFDALHEAATVKAGFDDFGSRDYQHGLRQLLSALDEDLRACPDNGRQVAVGVLTDVLVARLLTQEGWKRHSDYRQVRIHKPLIIVGLPRTGSTALHKLLATDPQFQGVPLWLFHSPMVRPPRDTWESNSWYRASITGTRDQEAEGKPTFDTNHDMSADTVDECFWGIWQDFTEHVFAAMFQSTTYEAWWWRQSELGPYRRYVDLLRLIGLQYHSLPGIPSVRFRGPRAPAADIASGNYFSCIGGAQTHGVYVQKPYPDLLAEKLDIPVLNLSLGGCGPGVYLMVDGILDMINNGRFVIVQVMTARTEGNSRMAPYGFVEAARDMKRSGEPASAAEVWGRILEEEPEHLPTYIAESQANWCRRYRDLIAQIKIPIILFNFAFKPLDEPIDTSSWKGLMYSFPQLVDMASVENIKAFGDIYVECRSKRNFGHPLVSRFTGKPVTVDYAALMDRAEFMRGVNVASTNDYYPSPEMHEDAADVTFDAVHALAKNKPGIIS